MPSPRRCRYRTVDVFTPRQLEGNPLAVFPEASGLDVPTMQRIARELNLAETVFIFPPSGPGCSARMFAPDYGVAEDPATGSATRPLALYMMRNGLVAAENGTRFVSEQGTQMGRRSLLHVHIKGHMGSDGIEVGGHVTPVAEATLTWIEQDRR